MRMAVFARLLTPGQHCTLRGRAGRAASVGPRRSGPGGRATRSPPPQLVDSPGEAVSSTAVNRHNFPCLLRLLLRMTAESLAAQPVCYAARVPRPFVW